MNKLKMESGKLNMKKILSILIFTLVVVSAVVAEKRFVILDKVVAVVGNSSVSYSDMQQAAKMILEQRRSEGYTSDRPAQDEAPPQQAHIAASAGDRADHRRAADGHVLPAHAAHRPRHGAHAGRWAAVLRQPGVFPR